MTQATKKPQTATHTTIVVVTRTVSQLIRDAKGIDLPPVLEATLNKKFIDDNNYGRLPVSSEDVPDHVIKALEESSQKCNRVYVRVVRASASWQLVTKKSRTFKHFETPGPHRIKRLIILPDVLPVIKEGIRIGKGLPLELHITNGLLYLYLHGDSDTIKIATVVPGRRAAAECLSSLRT